MATGLIILKLIMFTILLIGPVLIGRELTRAARGRSVAAPAPTPPTEAEEAA